MLDAWDFHELLGMHALNMFAADIQVSSLYGSGRLLLFGKTQTVWRGGV